MALRLGIVGCGAVHGTHAAAIDRIPDADIAGFYDIVPARAQASSEKYCAPAFETLEHLFEVSDAITVCTPSGLHSEIGIQAAKAGKHVLVEKPIDVTAEAAQRLIDACQKARVKLSVISQHRFAPDIRRLRVAIEDGTLGPLLEGDAYIKWYRTQAYYDSGDWRGTIKLDGGGCLINQGVHYIDMIQWLMGGVKSVQARVRTASHNIEVEDIASALIEYGSGALGVIQGSTSFYPGLAERLEIHGKRGTVVIEADRIKVWEIVESDEEDGSLYGRGVQMQPTPNIHLATVASDDLDSMDAAERWIEQHRLQIEDFVRSVLDDRDPYITGEMALEPLKTILAIYESSRRGGERVEVCSR